MNLLKDPIGSAVLDYSKNNSTENIIVHSDLCDDDIIPIEYLFREFNQMPRLEQKALNMCKGNVLDVGAGTGCHSKHLKDKGLDTFAIDTSIGCVNHIKESGLEAEVIPFLSFKNKKFDTILILMNGLGLAGHLSKMTDFLSHAKSLLKKEGCILADSSDIRYLYEEDDGGQWIDLNSNYPGEMEFQMEYKNNKSDWFPWVYIDFDTLHNIAIKTGLKATKIMEDENFHYLAKLEIL